jgi:hypothetical protein
VNVQRTSVVPASKRALAWEDYDREARLSDEEEATVYKTFFGTPSHSKGRSIWTQGVVREEAMS